MSADIAPARRVSRPLARSLATVHRDVIAGGFLTTLGLPFLTVLYHALSRDPGVHLVIARSDDRAIGFACTSLDLSATYRRFALRHGAAAAVAAARHLWRPSSIARLRETLRASRVGRAGEEAAGGEPSSLPVLMNLCVDGAHQRAGIGGAMLAETARWLEGNGRDAFIAVTGEDQASAVSFYHRLGATDEGVTAVHADSASRRFRVPTSALTS